MRFGIRKVADALTANRKSDAPKEPSTLNIADLKAIEAALVVRRRICPLISETKSPIKQSISFVPTTQGPKPRSDGSWASSDSTRGGPKPIVG